MPISTANNNYDNDSCAPGAFPKQFSSPASNTSELPMALDSCGICRRAKLRLAPNYMRTSHQIFS